MKLNLQGSNVLVVGGASGIGAACVDSFLAENAHVMIWDINPNVTGFVDQRERCDALVVDIASQSGVAEASEKTLDIFGHIDHLVHAAAIGSGKFGVPFTNLSPDDWTRVMDVNVGGMVNIAHAVTRDMVERGRGTMVFVSSVAGQIGSPTDPPYSASKAANINFAQVIAKDLASHGIRVNTVCPGMVKTPLNRDVWKAWQQQSPERANVTYETWAEEKIRDLVPLGTWQQPQDIADMIVFLSSSRAAQVTGQTINVDGGYVMHH